MSRFTRTLRSPWVIMPLAAALAFGGWFAFLRPDESEAADVPTDTVVEASVGTMSRTVSADGTVTAAESEDLSFSSSGTVTAVDVAAGDTVEAGQVLASIDPAELEAAVADAEASLADAEAKLADDTDADASEEQLAADASSVASAQDALDVAEESLEGAQLVATISGTVASVSIVEGTELGDGGQGGVSATGSGSGSGSSAGTLGSSSQTPGAASTGTDSTSSEAHISISSTGRFLVELGFDDTDIANVEVGQLATVSLSTSTSTTGFGGGGFPGGGAFPGAGGGTTANEADDEADADAEASEALDAAALGAVESTGPEGVVTEVGTVADASSGVASYPVTVAFADDSGEYNVGASVTVEIAYEEVADAIQVPSLAVTTADGTSTVEVQTDGGTETRTVTTGLTAGTMTQITDGLDAGESVVITLPGARGGGDEEDGSDVGTGGGGFGPPEGFTPPEGGQGPGFGGGS